MKKNKDAARKQKLAVRRAIEQERLLKEKVKTEKKRLASPISLLEFERNSEQSQEAIKQYAKRVELALENFDPRDGFIRAPLKIAAETIIDQLLRKIDTIDPRKTDMMHRFAVIEYYIMACGMIVHAFPNRPNIPGYYELREESSRRAKEVSST